MTDQQLTGKNIGVAVLDTGIFPHIDFHGRISGFVDFVFRKNQPYDDNGHGTHVAGILSGSGAASGGRVKGIAPGCTIVSLKVLDRFGNGRKEDVLQAFLWIRQHYKEYHIRIVNISVGTTYNTRREHEALVAGVEELWDEGLVVVAAAGNQGPAPGSITAPGSSKKIITVGSSDMIRENQGISGRGPTMDCICKPDIVAPGYHIVSCAPYRNGYLMKSGTSMSTPQVSGAIALLLEKKPDLTNGQIKLALKESAIDLGMPHNQQGWGALNLSGFLQHFPD
ncbi:MAG: S8 family peptidase [Blautia sp.]|jgi:serine protease AprX